MAPPGAACPALATCAAPLTPLRRRTHPFRVTRPGGRRQGRVGPRGARCLVINRDSGNGSILHSFGAKPWLADSRDLPRGAPFTPRRSPGASPCREVPGDPRVLRSLWDRVLQELVRVARALKRRKPHENQWNPLHFPRGRPTPLNARSGNPEAPYRQASPEASAQPSAPLLQLPPVEEVLDAAAGNGTWWPNWRKRGPTPVARVGHFPRLAEASSRTIHPRGGRRGCLYVLHDWSTLGPLPPRPTEG
jgi:hypothetical protein